MEKNTRGRKIRRLMNDDGVKVLPSDLWFEILRRIPVADLHPLKAVCKTFHRLISSDLFARLHLEHLIKDPKSKRAIITPRFRDLDHNSYYYDPDKSTISVRYDDKPIFNDLCQVIDSHHGLLLVQVGDRLDRFLLCNPITRSCKFLPQIYDFQQLSYWKLAYDDVSNQYKVFGLRIRKEREVSLYVFDVHRDQELHNPREKTAMDCQNMLLYYEGNVLVNNGNVYWLFKTLERETHNGEIIGRRRAHIISSSVTTEEVKTRSCSMQSCYWDSTIAANGTFYHYATSYPSYDELKLWVLEGVESENSNPSWTMKHIIHINQLPSTLSIAHVRVVGVFCNKVLIIRSHNCLDRLFQYDVSCKKFEGEVTLASGGKNIADFKFYRVVEHIDSLIKS